MSLLPFLLCACTASYYHLQPEFDLRLSAVDPPGQVSGNTGSSDSTVYEYNNSRTRFQWAAGAGAHIDFVLENLTADTMRILWEGARYVDERLDSHRVLHAGVKISARDQLRSTVVIPPLGKLVDFILPEHLIVENPARPGETLSESPLISVRDSNPRQVRRDARAMRGQKLQVLLPLEFAGQVTSYRFVFQIDQVTIR